MVPSVRNAVGSRVPLLMDGGIRRGTDILKVCPAGSTVQGQSVLVASRSKQHYRMPLVSLTGSCAHERLRQAYGSGNACTNLVISHVMHQLTCTSQFQPQHSSEPQV